MQYIYPLAVNQEINRYLEIEKRRGKHVNDRAALLSRYLLFLGNDS